MIYYSAISGYGEIKSYPISEVPKMLTLTCNYCKTQAIIQVKVGEKYTLICDKCGGNLKLDIDGATEIQSPDIVHGILRGEVTDSQIIHYVKEHSEE